MNPAMSQMLASIHDYLHVKKSKISLDSPKILVIKESCYLIGQKPKLA